jgi:GTPase SAR1 family protein
MIQEYDYLFKIVLVGNSSVGKSSLLRRYVEGDFSEAYLATIGVDFRFKYHFNKSEL